MGDLTSLNPSGLSSPVQGLPYLYLYHHCFILRQYEVLMKHEVLEICEYNHCISLVRLHVITVLVIPTSALRNLFIYTRSFPSYTSA